MQVGPGIEGGFGVVDGDAAQVGGVPALGAVEVLLVDDGLVSDGQDVVGDVEQWGVGDGLGVEVPQLLGVGDVEALKGLLDGAPGGVAGLGVSIGAKTQCGVDALAPAYRRAMMRAMPMGQDRALAAPSSRSRVESMLAPMPAQAAAAVVARCPSRLTDSVVIVEGSQSILASASSRTLSGEPWLQPVRAPMEARAASAENDWRALRRGKRRDGWRAKSDVLISTVSDAAGDAVSRIDGECCPLRGVGEAG